MIITDDKDKIIEAYKKEQVEYTNKFIDMQKEIERLNNKLEFKETNIKGLENNIEVLEEVIKKYENIIKEVREYIENNQEEHKFTDRGGFTYTEGLFLRDSDSLLEILDKVEE